MGDKYKEALEQAQVELAMLEERRVALLKLIGNLKALSQDELYELTPPPGYEPEGMTAEIRKILALTTVHLTATQIRDSLIQRGFATSNPKNLLIAVHTVLGRIEDELDAIERDGKKAYKTRRSYEAWESLADTFAKMSKVDWMGATAKAIGLSNAQLVEMSKTFNAISEAKKKSTKKFEPPAPTKPIDSGVPMFPEGMKKK